MKTARDERQVEREKTTESMGQDLRALFASSGLSSSTTHTHTHSKASKNKSKNL